MAAMLGNMQNKYQQSGQQPQANYGGGMQPPIPTRSLSAGESGAFTDAGGAQVPRGAFTPEQMAAGQAGGRVGFGLPTGPLQTSSPGFGNFGTRFGGPGVGEPQAGGGMQPLSGPTPGFQNPLAGTADSLQQPGGGFQPRPSMGAPAGGAAGKAPGGAPPPVKQAIGALPGAPPAGGPPPGAPGQGPGGGKGGMKQAIGALPGAPPLGRPQQARMQAQGTAYGAPAGGIRPNPAMQRRR